MIQLLPVNDTSVYNMWWDSYPYSSVSVSSLLSCPYHSSKALCDVNGLATWCYGSVLH